MFRLVLARAVFVVAALGAAATPAPAGDVEGTVVLPDKKPSRAPRAGGRYPGGKPAPAEYRRGPAVVFIDGVTEGAPFKPPQEKPVIAQKDRQFVPLALPILVGTTVTFPNRDNEYHNVFSRSTPKQLELGRYGQDETREETFDKPGLVRLRCEIHSHMHGVILVLDNPCFAVADEKGDFSIKGVPPGKYKVYAFHEDYEPKDKDADPLRAVGQDIEVAKDGAVRVEFDLRDPEKPKEPEKEK